MLGSVLYSRLKLPARNINVEDPQELGFENVQEFINTASEELKELEAHDTTLPMTAVSAGSTEEEVNSFYDNYSAEMDDNTHYRAIVDSLDFAHSVFGGYAKYFEGMKRNDNTEWQTLTSYGSKSSSNQFTKFTRSKVNGTWTPWKAVDIGNVLTANKNVYVDATNGDDTTGDGTQAKPWKTIQKAVNECPNVKNGDVKYTIYLTKGDYNESIVINKGVKINIIGSASLDESDNYKVKNITICGYSEVYLQGMYFYGNPNTNVNTGITTNMVSMVVVYLQYCKFDDCIAIADEGTSMALVNCDFSNYRSGSYTYGAIYSKGGNISCYNITGSNNKVGVNSGGNARIGGIIRIAKSQWFLTADNPYFTDNGGRILIDSQGWQTIGSVTGANSVAIDSEKYTEFKVKVFVPNRGCYTFYITSVELSTTATPYIDGSAESASYLTAVAVNATKTAISLSYVKQNGTSDATTSTMTVYGRRV